MCLPKLCCLNESTTIRLPQLLVNNEAISATMPQLASISLKKDLIMATSGEFVHFAWHIPHLPRMVPKACLSCLRQLDTLS
jgi:hypothetical protein